MTCLRCVNLRYSTIKQLAPKMTACVVTSKPSHRSLFFSHNLETLSAIFSHRSRVHGLLLFLLLSCVWLCTPTDCSMPGFSVLHHLLEFAQTHVHWVGVAIQPSHPLSSPSPSLSIFPRIRVFSNESALRIRWPQYSSFSISPSNE